jgi:hypothetical protein
VKLVGVGVVRYDELRCWDMTTSLVFFSGLNSTMYSLGKNKQLNCTSPLEEMRKSQPAYSGTFYSQQITLDMDMIPLLQLMSFIKMYYL